MIKLTPEQERVTTQALGAGQGVIVAPPGSGKTIMGLELIARHQKPALILTHRKQLLDQWVEHIQKHLAIPKKQIGRFGVWKQMLQRHRGCSRTLKTKILCSLFAGKQG